MKNLLLNVHLVFSGNRYRSSLTNNAAPCKASNPNRAQPILPSLSMTGRSERKPEKNDFLRTVFTRFSTVLARLPNISAFYENRDAAGGFAKEDWIYIQESGAFARK
ncbi:MAG TPA: hypothetical protein VK041_04055, partial [Opitutales bacterium]|nr:hypothetical protein [Opitutales bacterium]